MKRQQPRNLTLSFHLNAYEKSKGFEFPRHLATLLGLKKNDRIALTIKRPKSGELLYHGVTTLTSGTEVLRRDVFKNIQPGEELCIAASRPPA